MTRGSIARMRMQRQRLLGAPFQQPVDAVRWLVAVQAQEFPYAKWSLAQRSRDAKETAIDRAFAGGAILRTHVLRPTWHFVLPADLRWLVQLTAPRVNARMAPYDRHLELDDRIYAKCNRLVERALRDGVHKTRRELAAALQAGGIVAGTQRLAHLMMRAELDLVVCSGAPKGKQQTYALVDERAPRAKALPREEALAELTRRYFASHGPATLRDFAWWSGLTMADVRRGADGLGKSLERIVVDGRSDLEDASARPARPGAAGALLLQGYDEYVIAYTESKDVFYPAGAARRTSNWVSYAHAVVIDGRVAGHWRRAPGEAVVVEAGLFAPLGSRDQRALRAEVGRYGRFIGSRSELRLR